MRILHPLACIRFLPLHPCPGSPVHMYIQTPVSQTDRTPSTTLSLPHQLTPTFSPNSTTTFPPPSSSLFYKPPRHSTSTSPPLAPPSPPRSSPVPTTPSASTSPPILRYSGSGFHSILRLRVPQHHPKAPRPLPTRHQYLHPSPGCTLRPLFCLRPQLRIPAPPTAIGKRKPSHSGISSTRQK